MWLSLFINSHTQTYRLQKVPLTRWAYLPSSRDRSMAIGHEQWRSQGGFGGWNPHFKSIRFANNELRRQTFYTLDISWSWKCTESQLRNGTDIDSIHDVRVLLQSRIFAKIVSDARCAEWSVVGENPSKVFEFARRGCNLTPSSENMCARKTLGKANECLTGLLHRKRNFTN